MFHIMAYVDVSFHFYTLFRIQLTKVEKNFSLNKTKFYHPSQKRVKILQKILITNK